MTPIITLSLLKFLENNGFGKIDEDLFWEKLGIGKDGVYIADMGSSQDRGMRPSVSYEMYSRANDDVAAFTKLEQIRRFLLDSYTICKLPSVPDYTAYSVHGVTITPPSTITNAGFDADGHIIYSFNGTIYFNSTERDVGDGKAILTEEDKELLTENKEIIETEENGRRS